MRKYYTVYDREKMRVGIAKANHFKDVPQLTKLSY
jgi:hypothetical protein